MKKAIITLLLSCMLLFTSTEVCTATSQTAINISATTPEFIYQDDNIIIECTLATSNSAKSIQTYSTTTQRNASKTVNIKTSSGTVLATYKLTATFTYNGKSATCTNASYSSTIKNSKWNFSSRTASKSGNKATGSYKLKNSSSGKIYSGSISITCNKNGKIS